MNRAKQGTRWRRDVTGWLRLRQRERERETRQNKTSLDDKTQLHDCSELEAADY